MYVYQASFDGLKKEDGVSSKDFPDFHIYFDLLSLSRIILYCRAMFYHMCMIALKVVCREGGELSEW